MKKCGTCGQPMPPEHRVSFPERCDLCLKADLDSFWELWELNEARKRREDEAAGAQPPA